ncbi:MAG TPA: hypothetical protein VEI83_13050 [Acidimicrobiales bacterium]|nr:hypothetical protein [Acidimicrobiales bacterium]
MSRHGPRHQDVRVSPGPQGTFVVEVGSGPGATTHHVTVPEGYAARLGLGTTPPEDLVAASFAFLLEREPPTSILRRFRLDVIGEYFPDYPDVIGGYVA